MSVTITNSLAPLDEVELQRFEERHRIRFPDEYRAFLLINNGGKPTPCSFAVNLNGFDNASDILYLLGINDVEAKTINKYVTSYRERIPTNLIPIAIELSVDLICLSVASNDFGYIYFWDHNWEVTETEPDYSNVHFLANGFSTFLGKLYDRHANQ